MQKEQLPLQQSTVPLKVRQLSKSANTIKQEGYTGHPTTFLPFCKMIQHTFITEPPRSPTMQKE